ncbi:YaiI/YqxD family protein [Propionivibrio soli]|uniref:YaiI/YqxD family protein n=1 Tax=Propionivibrio soli TaxID=2976531 RepID=UPI0021E82BEA|nr:YaiI/YqxD family protein [Propionivibrio soli]
MTIWVDADACPKVIREILFRAAVRAREAVVLVANQPLRVPPSPFIRTIHVAAGFDVADNEIAKRVAAGDLVITCDLPLAAEVIEKGARVLSHRGEWYSAENIRPLLNMRDFMDNLRASGVQTGGPPAMTQAERQVFAGHLDRFLADLADRA